MKLIGFIVLAIVALLCGYSYYYVTLPAINIHSPGFWWFILIGMLIISIVILFATMNYNAKAGEKFFKNNLFKLSITFTAILLVIYSIGSLLSSPIVNAKKYQQMLTINDRDFATDIKEISYNEIPVLDKSTAQLLGSRKMGSMVQYVSQYEVANNYTQINYKGNPTRVTPLKYGSFIKWFSNRKQGIPAYVSINMTNQDVNLVQLAEGMKYTESDLFGRNINRYLRFNYPTYIFDTINFEIDDNGTPFWICPVNDYTIGLFGGRTIDKVVTVNAITGEHTKYDVVDTPQWIDRVFSAELLIEQYDYHGTLKHGYLNSIFGQKDSLETTDGYNYIALDDDVWVYTGVTSTGGDESNVAFILMNQRTAETRYYPISGAEEYSAMASAEGQVQHLGYKATFPLLLNIGGQPTYFIALKDAAGLVKQYAMVNIEQYQLVAIGNTIQQVEKAYIELTAPIEDTSNIEVKTITSNIKKIVEAVVDANSFYYILLDDTDEIFALKLSDFIDIIKFNEGDYITLNYKEGSRYNTVIGLQ